MLSKKVRAFDLESLAEDRKIKMVKAHWNQKVVDQLVAFTGKMEEDDIVDTCTGSAALPKTTAEGDSMNKKSKGVPDAFIVTTNDGVGYSWQDVLEQYSIKADTDRKEVNKSKVMVLT